jgi:small subunit ribosomal protein S8e
MIYARKQKMFSAYQKSRRIFIMKTGKKSTGGRYKKSRKKKLYEKPGLPRQVILGEESKKSLTTRGGHIKTVLLKTNIVNVYDPKEKKSQVVKIKNVIEVPSNVFLARKNVIVKGAILDTEKGKARVTNRPGQEGQVQAILI